MPCGHKTSGSFAACASSPEQAMICCLQELCSRTRGHHRWDMCHSQGVTTRMAAVGHMHLTGDVTPNTLHVRHVHMTGICKQMLHIMFQ
jgi:hypothetical protein